MSKGGAILVPSGDRPRPKSLIEAISDIQMYANMERDGQPVPVGYLMLREQLSFVEVGLKGGLISTIISGLTMPISIAVIQELFPIFGERAPSMFDQLFALLLSISFQLGYNLMIAMNLSACYIGAWCRKAVWCIYSGVLAGKLLVGAVLFIGYHWLYLLFSPERIARSITQAEFALKLLLVPVSSAQRLQDWLIEFRHVFLISAWMMVLMLVLTAGLSLALFVYGVRTINKEEATRRLYDEA